MAADGVNFDKYIDNPKGDNVSVVTNRQMYKELYTNKFNAILLRENGIIKFKVYHCNDKNDTYYIHMKIPSEPISNFYYDVVVQLSTRINPKKVDSSLRNYMVRFFSNDPAFAFTFAHAFKKKDMFIKDLEPLMMKKSLSSVAKERNPSDEIFYVKSLYFAYLTMERYGLFKRPMLQQVAGKYDKKTLMKSITPAETKIKQRQEEGVKLEKEKRAEKKEMDTTAKPEQKYTVKRSAIAKTATVSNISRKSKTVKTVKKK